jgi:hypothetical protein
MSKPEYGAGVPDLDREIEELMAEQGRANARLETELNAVAEIIAWLDELEQSLARLLGEMQ